MIPKSGYRFSEKIMLSRKAFSKSLKARDRRVRGALSRDHAQRCVDGVQHAIELHRCAGFRMVGTFDNVGFKFGRWLDSVLMQRPLGAGATTAP